MFTDCTVSPRVLRNKKNPYHLPRVILKVPLPNEEMFNSNMDWIHNLMLNTTRQNFLRRIEKLDNVVLLSPHRVPFMDRFLGEFNKGSRDRSVHDEF